MTIPICHHLSSRLPSWAGSNAGPDGGLFLRLRPMKKIPLVQLVTESLEPCNHQFRCESHLRWKIRPRSHFPTESLWIWWNHKFAGKPAGEMLQDENGECYCLVEISRPGGDAPLYIWSERVAYIIHNKEDHPQADAFGGFMKNGGAE